MATKRWLIPDALVRRCNSRLTFFEPDRYRVRRGDLYLYNKNMRCYYYFRNPVQLPTGMFWVAERGNCPKYLARSIQPYTGEL